MLTLKYNSCYEASKNNDLEQLILLHQTGYQLKFTCMTHAVKNNNIEMLDYLLKHNCPINRSLTITVAEQNSTKFFTYLIENSILGTQLDWHPNTTDYIVENSNLELLKYCVDNNAPLSYEITVSAAKKGNLEYLKYAVEKGSYKHPNAIKYAVIHNQINCLRYLIDKKFPMTSDITIYVATYDRLEFLKCLINVDGFRWNPETTYFAANKGHIEVLMYCLQNGCPLHQNTFKALRNVTPDILKLDFNNIPLRSFVFELYQNHPELRTCYFGEKIKEEMDKIEMKKKSIKQYTDICNDIMQYCIFNYI